MRPASKARLAFIILPEQRIVVIRPIGPLSAQSFIDSLFEHYSQLDSPWTYGRLNDFRRFEGYLADEHLQEIADRWRSLAQGQDYHAHVAVVSLDAHDRIRVPAVSPMFPNETICLFSDYHEAIGWLVAADRSSYLSDLSQAPRPPDRNGSIHID